MLEQTKNGGKQKMSILVPRNRTRKLQALIQSAQAVARRSAVLLRHATSSREAVTAAARRKAASRKLKRFIRLEVWYTQMGILEDLGSNGRNAWRAEEMSRGQKRRNCSQKKQ
jgi:hypothetical protein